MTKPRLIPVVPLSEMSHGQEADLFVLMTAKEEQLTRDGKTYYRVAFRDAGREVSFPIWNDAPLAEDCRQAWTPGRFYKLRATYRETTYGPQLDIQRIRETTAGDAADGFDPLMCQPRSAIEPEALFAELIDLANREIAYEPLRALVVELLREHRETLLALPASVKNHHVHAGGWLEHTLSVARQCVFMAGHFTTAEPSLPLDRDVLVAGAVLHDIGKVRELDLSPLGAETSAAGYLVGHIVQGRDMIREAAVGRDIAGETLLRLEHLILAHQPAEHGALRIAMTAEALILQHADDLDAKLHMLMAALRDDRGAGPVTSKKNVLMQHIYRGPTE